MTWQFWLWVVAIGGIGLIGFVILIVSMAVLTIADWVNHGQ